MTMQQLYLLVPLAAARRGDPRSACSARGSDGRLSHWLCILGVAVATVASVVIWRDVMAGARFNGDIYTWLQSGSLKLAIGFLIDPLTATMMVVVSFVSLMVHVYTIGYMADDPGYTRFFSYISLFTFSMLMLVMSNNFVQLFFGWEAVGLVSYLLIGFWYTRPTAIYANLKAFLVNRVGDFGFVLGIGLVLAHFGSLDYAPVFARADGWPATTINLWGATEWSLLTVICICLFVGAMGKSAQVPLHVWLPDSMEGPTPISALIHAATMVTAGIFMVARMSPLFELSDTALSFVTVIGATTALFMGFLGIVQNDIKRVVAYSTLSQLGYMTVALGVSAYSAAIFHLMTHAFFKALLFLGAGSVIIALHHEQDLRKMGGLRKYMPITWITALVGSLALAGIPPFAGFFSKDAIIEAVQLSKIPGHGYAYFAVMAGVFVTAFYSFRMLFLAFHGKERFDRPGRRRSTTSTRPSARRRARGRDEPTPTATTAGRRRRARGWSRCRWSCWRSRRSSPAGSTSSRCCSATTSATRSSCGPSTRCSGNSRTSGTASPHSSSTACCSLPFWLALAGGIVAAWYCYLVNPALPARDQAGVRADLHAARQQVLLRPLQRLVLRRRRAPRRRRVLWQGRRRDDHRRLLRQRLGAAGRLGRRRCCATCSRATSTTTRSR